MADFIFPLLRSKLPELQHRMAAAPHARREPMLGSSTRMAGIPNTIYHAPPCRATILGILGWPNRGLRAEPARQQDRDRAEKGAPPDRMRSPEASAFLHS